MVIPQPRMVRFTRNKNCWFLHFKPPLWQYQLRMWACSETNSYWKGSWVVINWKCPPFFFLQNKCEVIGLRKCQNHVIYETFLLMKETTIVKTSTIHYQYRFSTTILRKQIFLPIIIENRSVYPLKLSGTETSDTVLEKNVSQQTANVCLP